MSHTGNLLIISAFPNGALYGFETSHNLHGLGTIESRFHAVKTRGFKLDAGGRIQPTVEQAFKCLSLFQMLSNGFQPIHLFRFDDKSGEIFILAGINEGIEIVVFRNGLWEFTDE